MAHDLSDTDRLVILPRIRQAILSLRANSSSISDSMEIAGSLARLSAPVSSSCSESMACERPE